MQVGLESKSRKISLEKFDKFIKNKGIDIYGITEIEEFEEWVKEITRFYFDNKFYANMEWLAKTATVRLSPRDRFSQARTMIVFGKTYSPMPVITREGGLISSYAKGIDYHSILGKIAEKICEYLVENGARFVKAYVDTGPVFEKYWASKAGLGWIGKNSLLINKKLGSYFFLATILTDMKVSQAQSWRGNEKSRKVENYCGSCTRCISACPTGAIIKNGVIDSNKCIAYLTVEHKGIIKKDLEDKIDRWIFGCDICQQVCPWNKKNFLSALDQHTNSNYSIISLLQLTKEKFQEMFKNSPIRRVKWEGFMRNLIIVAGNLRLKESRKYISKFLYSQNYTLIVTAIRALAKLKKV